jgi:hypothetical protein
VDVVAELRQAEREHRQSREEIAAGDISGFEIIGRVVAAW